MTLLDTIQSLSAGPLGWGTLVAALAALLRILPGAIDRISKALAKAWERRADADADRAATERTEAEAFTAMLSRYETRLTEAEAEAREARAEALLASKRVEECERRHTEREQLVADLRETVAEQAGEIASLRERVDRMTPQPMRAVKE